MGKTKNISDKSITIEELEKLLSDEGTAAEAFNKYFEYIETGPFSGSFNLKEGLIITKKEKHPELEGFIVSSAKQEGLDLANSSSRKRRKKDYLKVKNDSKRIRVVSEGDSWFQYPRFSILGLTVVKGVKDIIDHLMDKDNLAIKSLDAGGDVLRNMYHMREYIQTIREEDPQLFLISAGGNDFFEVFPKMLQPNDNGDNISGWLGTNFMTELNVIGTYYRALFSEVVREFPDLHVLVHGYDYVIPRKNGKWLGKPMIEFGISTDIERRKLIKYAIDAFNTILEEITSENEFKHRIHYIDVRGTVPPDKNEWADEIHPNDKSFGKVAEKVFTKIQELFQQPKVNPT